MKMHDAFAPVASTASATDREDRDAVDVGAGLLRVRARDDLGAVLAVEQPVEAALRAGEALVDDLGVLVDEDAHLTVPSRRARDRTRAGRVEHGGLHLQPVGQMRLEDRSALVGVRAVEADHDRRVDRRPARAPATMPFATSSPLVMPPKMLMKIDRTFGSLLITSSAPVITSAFAPPPMSRKFAGCAADLAHDVDGAHREPGAVGDDADVAVEPDVLQALLVRGLLALVAAPGSRRTRS